MKRTEDLIYRFLIVEDNPSFAKGLTLVLQKQYPRCLVSIGKTVEEAHALITAASISQAPYDIMILDYRMALRPAKQGEVGKDEVSDNATANRATVAFPDALIIRTSSYVQSLNDAKMETARYDKSGGPAILDQYASPTSKSRILFVPKDIPRHGNEPEPLFAQPILQAIEEHLPDVRIRKRLRELERAHSGQAIMGRSDPEESRLDDQAGVAHRSSLAGDAAENWDKLDEELQKRLKMALGWIKIGNAQFLGSALVPAQAEAKPTPSAP